MTVSVSFSTVINPGVTNVITVEQADMTLVQSSPDIYELDMDVLRNTLRTLEADDGGSIYPPTHSHNTTVTIGTLFLGRSVIFLAPYTLTFEDGQYAVRLTGANTNLEDIMNVNQVSLRSSNSAGLAAATSDGVWGALISNFNVPGTFGWFVQKLLTVGKFLALKG